MKTRIKIAKRLAADLSKFDVSMKGKFMCPVCTDIYDCDDETNITDAHIIPVAIEGKDLTLLCRSCNSRLGANQDRWFGEYLDILLREKTLLSAKTKSKYLTLNGLKVRGDVRESEDGIDIFLHIDRNPPGLVESTSFGTLRDISLEIPLAKNQKLIEVGYLTAAYLLWFKQLGYSWVFQSHLDCVRRQIQSPLQTIIEGPFLIDITHKKITRACTGVLDLGDRAYPCSVIYDRLVVLPMISDKNVLASVQEKIKDAPQAHFYSLNISRAHNHVGPMGVIYKTSPLVIPDQFASGKIKPKLLLFPDSNQSPVWLTEVSESEARNTQDSHEYAVSTIKVRAYDH